MINIRELIKVGESKRN
jgi:hypothetical protein